MTFKIGRQNVLRGRGARLSVPILCLFSFYVIMKFLVECKALYQNLHFPVAHVARCSLFLWQEYKGQGRVGTVADILDCIKAQHKMLRRVESHKTEGAWAPEILKPQHHFMKSPSCIICVEDGASIHLSLAWYFWVSLLHCCKMSMEWLSWDLHGYDISSYRPDPGPHVLVNFGGLHLPSIRASIPFQGCPTLHNDPRLVCD